MMKVMVIGAGTMGAGIAQMAAAAGCTVVLNDISDEFVDKGLRTISRDLSRSLDKGKISQEEVERILAFIRGIADAEQRAKEAGDTDLLIEAIVENTAVKKNLYAELDGACPPQTIFASNTSALSISELAASTSRAERFVGLHFFNPVPVMQLVEIIAGAATSPGVVESMREFVERIGKVPVVVAEAPGFVVNRILIPMVNEAVFTVMEGVAKPEDVDAAMRLGANHPIGPLSLADMIGLDICLAVMETLHREFGDSKYRPAPLLRKMVRAGLLGRKTGQGFFTY
jgi:3-hydroxybutyryl-CoA dehydrogenase